MNDNLKTLYQVWHKEPQGYVHALTVHSKDLLTALVLPMVTPRDDEVSELVASPRPTTFGDVIVSPQHDAYRVASTKHGITFDEIDFPPARTAKLTAEMREEVRAGIADGLRFGATLSEIMNGAAAYGVKPEEVAEIGRQAETERER